MDREGLIIVLICGGLISLLAAWMYKRQNPDKKILPRILIIVPAVFAGLFFFGQVEKNKADQRDRGNTITEQSTPQKVYVGDKYVYLGMSSEEAGGVWGKPDNINRTTGTWGVHEQWIYGQRQTYLYFENSKLTSWQEHK